VTPSAHPPRERATLSRPLADFLIELSIALHKHAIYAWSQEAALAHLESQAGTEFDPEVASALVRMLRVWEPQIAVLTDERSAVITADVPPSSETPPTAAATQELGGTPGGSDQAAPG
jgi:hypothetical protein